LALETAGVQFIDENGGAPGGAVAKATTGRSGPSGSREHTMEMTLTDSIIPDGFLRFSDAVSRLAEGMWGGLRRPIPVHGARRTFKNASVIFGPWGSKQDNV
jgi:hypothetical protein